jgi:sideroflexin-1/3
MATDVTTQPTRINLNNPRYDQSTFEGRAKHFFITTNPLNCLATEQQLLEAKRIVDEYRSGKNLSDLGITEDKLWEMKQLYDSAFHPQTGEMLILPGRMSFQVVLLIFCEH